MVNGFAWTWKTWNGGHHKVKPRTPLLKGPSWVFGWHNSSTFDDVNGYMIRFKGGHYGVPIWQNVVQTWCTSYLAWQQYISNICWNISLV